MKKLISLALALVMILSLATVAFAEDGGETPDAPEETPATITYDNAIPFQKIFNNTNSGKLPSMGFYFNATGVSYKNNEGVASIPDPYPTVKLSDMYFDGFGYMIQYTGSNPTAASATIDFNATINVADFEIGTYVYKITETDSNKLGVTCDTTPIYLKLYIVWKDETEGTKQYYAVLSEDEDFSTKVETGTFTNSYQSGSLKVTKTVKGNNIDPNKKFKFTVTFSNPTTDTYVSEIIPTTDGDNGGWVNGETATNMQYTVELGNGEYVKFTNIAAGLNYTVTEVNEGYEETSVFSDTAATKTISAGDEDTAAFTNTKNADITTGVILESAPYILLLALAAAGMFLLLTKKRSREY